MGGVVLSGVFGKHKDYKVYWATAFYAEYQQEYDPHNSTTDVFMGKFRFGRQLHRWLQIGAEAQLMKLKNAETSSEGLGGAVYFSWYFINTGSFRVYFDNGFGVVSTTKNFPKGGTSFNFTSFYGLSADFKLQPDTFMKIGVRNMHLSNAYLFGEDRNPAFDSIGFHIGFEL
ncbi:MAG: acyloxyacyl hydrolase [Flavobacteriaceae bacterium]|nr:acyloxyacyl hydrolase [Flavobacteriaceae bacterium]